MRIVTFLFPPATAYQTRKLAPFIINSLIWVFSWFLIVKLLLDDYSKVPMAAMIYIFPVLHAFNLADEYDVYEHEDEFIEYYDEDSE